MSNTNDILFRLIRCEALLGVVADDLDSRGADVTALQAVQDLLKSICQDFKSDIELEEA